MKKLFKLIELSNKWYDNLPNGKRQRFFVFVIMGSFLFTQILFHIYNLWYVIPIWVGLVFLWRLPYFKPKKKRYSIDIETGEFSYNPIIYVNDKEVEKDNIKYIDLVDELIKIKNNYETNCSSIYLFIVFCFIVFRLS